MAQVLYAADATWSPAFPAGSHTFSAVAVHNGEVYISQRGNTTLEPILVLSAVTGKLHRSWGSTYVATSGGTWGAHGLQVDPHGRVWIDDFWAHALIAFDSNGSRLLVSGTGTPGNGTSPVQFDHVADTVCDGEGGVYSSDGDGGRNNRVVKLRVHPPAIANPAPPSLPGSSRIGGMSTLHATLAWSTATGLFNNPHSIALHKRSGVLVIADREGSSTRLLRAADGADLGRWDCGLAGGGKPFGVRFMSVGDLDVLFLAVYDNPGDGKHQRIDVIDASGMHPEWAAATQGEGTQSEEAAVAHGHDQAARAPPACTILQTLHVDPMRLSGPHLLGVDATNGDLYAALVGDAPRSTVLRYRRVASGGTQGTGPPALKSASSVALFCLLSCVGVALVWRDRRRCRQRGLSVSEEAPRVCTRCGAEASDGGTCGASNDSSRENAEVASVPEAWHELNAAAQQAAIEAEGSRAGGGV